MDSLFLLWWIFLVWLCRIEYRLHQASKKTDAARYAQGIIWHELLRRTKRSDANK